MQTVRTARDLKRWCCIICPWSAQSTLVSFWNWFLNFTSSIHAKIMYIYMFWIVFGQIVQMMMHNLHDRVCIFCFLSFLVKNGTYTQCKTAKPVSEHAHFVTDRQTYTQTHARTYSNLSLSYTKGPSGKNGGGGKFGEGKRENLAAQDRGGGKREEGKPSGRRRRPKKNEQWRIADQPSK